MRVEPRAEPRNAAAASLLYRMPAAASDKPVMGFDPLVTNPGRLTILAALAGEGERALEFVRLRARTRLTDGNLAAHAKRLQSGGLILVDKRFESGKPVTRFTLTPVGRKALEEHVRRISAAIAICPQDVALDAAQESTVDALDEDWVD